MTGSESISVLSSGGSEIQMFPGDNGHSRNPPELNLPDGRRSRYGGMDLTSPVSRSPGKYWWALLHGPCRIKTEERYPLSHILFNSAGSRRPIFLVTHHKDFVWCYTLGWLLLLAIFVTSSLSPKWMKEKSWKTRAPIFFFIDRKNIEARVRGVLSLFSWGYRGQWLSPQRARKAVSCASGHGTKVNRGGLTGQVPEEPVWWMESTRPFEPLGFGLDLGLTACYNISHLLSTYCVFYLNAKSLKTLQNR